MKSTNRHLQYIRSIFIIIMLLLLCHQVHGALPSSDTDKAQINAATIKTYEFEIDNEEVTPETWRSINLEMHKADSSLVKIDLLRPLWWLEKANAKIDSMVFLSMGEMGIEGKQAVS